MNVADAAALEQLLAPDALLIVDGDARTPLRGGPAVARYVSELFGRHDCGELTPAHVNGSLALMLRSRSEVVAVVTLTASATHVHTVWIVLDPDKHRRRRRPN